MERQAHKIKKHDTHLNTFKNIYCDKGYRNTDTHEDKSQGQVLRIGLLTPHNPLDRNSFSGTIYYMRSSIEQHPQLKLEIIGAALHESKVLRQILSLSGRLGEPFSKIVYILYSRLFALFADIELHRRKDIDVIIAPVASKTLALLKDIETLPPIIFVTDATPLFIRDCYKENITTAIIETERKALSRSAKVIYSSKFMADRARNEFPDELIQPKNKISVIPFGLNADFPPKKIQPKVLSGTLELLFVGKSWERKGGDIALATLVRLTKQNIACRLTIIGCTPPDHVQKDNVEVHSYLDKNSSADRELFESIQQRSHFLLLPTRGDCTPMVIAEANAFGTPVICTDVGGISTLVNDGINGKLMNLSDTAESYASIIIELIAKADDYYHLSHNSRKTFEQKLNWQSWSNRFATLAERAAQAQEAAPASEASVKPQGIQIVSAPLNTTESVL